MKKRLFALFLVLTMVLGMLPVTAAAQEEKLYGEVPFVLYTGTNALYELAVSEDEKDKDNKKNKISLEDLIGAIFDKMINSALLV